MTKIAVSGSASRSGSFSQRHGSADPDPDPHKNVMDPQHCLLPNSSVSSSSGDSSTIWRGSLLSSSSLSSSLISTFTLQERSSPSSSSSVCGSSFTVVHLGHQDNFSYQRYNWGPRNFFIEIQLGPQGTFEWGPKKNFF
jgi:hypothetical protein